MVELSGRLSGFKTRSRCFALRALCLLVACLALVPYSAQAKMWRIVVYGDSLTSGYQLQPEEAFSARLEGKLKAGGYAQVEVINMSVAGETTFGGVQRLDSVLTHSPDMVILALGANDGLRGVEIGAFHKNLVAMISRLLTAHIEVILAGMKAPPANGYDYSRRFEASYRALAQTYTLPFHPFLLEGVVANPHLNLGDGLHPSAKGVEVMVEKIYPLVAARLGWMMQKQQSLSNTR